MNEIKRRIAGIAAVTFASVIFVSSRVQAQQLYTVSMGQAPAPEATTPLALLERLDWDPAQRGPLLIVAPESTNASNGRAFFTYTEPSPLGEPGPNGYRASDLFTHLSRKEMSVGGLTVVAPLSQYVLRYMDLPEPDLWRGIPSDKRLNYLLATFTLAQWQQLLTSNGIGIGDMNRSQKGFFTALFPAGLRLRRTEAPTQENTSGKTADITPTQPEEIRLRLFRRLKWDYQYQQGQNSTLSVGASPQSSQDGKPAYWIQYPQEEQQASGFSAIAYGVDLMSMQPNRLKASDIDYAIPALDFPVSLTGAKQVGDLIDRLKTATGLELYADLRIAELPVYIRTAGGMVRSGDLMKALALAVTGTYRKVSDGSSTVYVLTDDRVGMGTRQAIIGDWLRQAGLNILSLQETVDKGLAGINASSTAPWPDDTGKAPSAAVQESLARSGGSGEAKGIPVKELPEDIQTAIRNQTRDLNDRARQESNPGNSLIRDDVVNLSSTLEFGFVLPSGEIVPIGRDNSGSISISSTFGLIPGTSTKIASALPLRLSAKTATERILCVTIKTATEAKQTAEIAQAHGLNGLMLTCDPSTTPSNITEWVNAIRHVAPGVKVSLRVRPLWESEEETPGEGIETPAYDLNLLGETSAQFARRRKKEKAWQSETQPVMLPGNRGYWLRSDDSKSAQLIADRVVAMMAVPGVSSLLLTDLLPPGYDFFIMGQQSEFDPEGHYGYTPSLRLALIRKVGVDPIDLSPYGEDIGAGYAGDSTRSVRMLLPFLPDYGPQAAHMIMNGVAASKIGAKDSYGRWNMMRYQSVSTLRNLLAETISQKFPKSEVWTESNWAQVNVIPLPNGGIVIPIIDWKEAKAGDALMKDVPSDSFGKAAISQNYLIPFRYYDSIKLKNQGMRGAERFRRSAEAGLGLFREGRPNPIKSVVPIPAPTKPARGFMIPARGFMIDVSDYSLEDVAEFLRDLSIVP